MAEEILVTGAAGGDQGATGNHVVRLLTAAGARVRAFVHREDSRSSALRELGAEVVVGDFLNAESVDQGVRDVRAAFFAYPVQDGLLEATAIFADAARRAGIQAVVNLSQMNASAQMPSPTSRRHWWSERVFDWSGVGVVHVRGAVFYQNILRQTFQAIREEGALSMPLGAESTVLPLVDAEDIARVVAAVLTDPSPHLGKTYSLVGQALTVRELVDQISEHAGREITYKAISDQAWRERAVREQGARNPTRIEHLSYLWQTLVMATESGLRLPAQPELIQTLVGQRPCSFSEFVGRHASELRSAGGRAKTSRGSRTVEVEHVEVWTAKPLADVVRHLETQTGVFDPAKIKASVEAGDSAHATLDVIAAMAGPNSFMRMATLNHGAILALRGHPNEAFRFLIGHPLIAATMTMHQIGAGLYAPLSLLVAADDRGGTRLEYDRPSTLLGQFGDSDVLRVGRELDEKFGALVESATI